MKLFRRPDPTPLSEQPDCHEVARVLQSFLDGELGPQDAEHVAAHLAACEHCDLESRTVDAVREAIREQRPDLDIDSLTRLEAFVDNLADGSGSTD